MAKKKSLVKKVMKEVIVFVVSHGKRLIFEGLDQEQANQAAIVFKQRNDLIPEIMSFVYAPTDYT